MTNEYPKPENDGTPNYYQGGVPNNAVPQPPAHDPLPSNPYAQPQYNAQQPYGVQQPLNAGYANHPYPPNPYQQQPYGVVQQTPTNKNAIISLIASLGTLFILCGIPVIGTIAAIVGIVFGHKALKETEEVPNSGRGMAIAGTILGYMSLLASIVVSLLVILIIVGSIASEAHSY